MKYADWLRVISGTGHIAIWAWVISHRLVLDDVSFLSLVSTYWIGLKLMVAWAGLFLTAVVIADIIRFIWSRGKA